ncbi:ABC transporter permease [Comamonadaceae bacterium G21597-S1]|nr:ABC transporter permease [Comamonadaceae bacterium G21597-S1]
MLPAPSRAASPSRLDRAWAAALALLLGLPLAWSLLAAVRAGTELTAWHAMATAAQTWPALALSLWTGVAASALAIGTSAWILSRSFPYRWPPVVRLLGPMLAVPHAAFGIGLVFLISPSGWLLRLVSPWASGFDAPPPWPTSQDPWGLGLIAALVAKEVPFLLWAAAAHLQRADVAQRLRRELDLARSLGYSPATAWWRVVWPQLWPRLRWPMLAVLAYSLTVVDVALVIGPQSPPTLAVQAWTWLRDADPAVNQQGAAAAWLLAAALAVVAALAWWLPRRAWWRRRRTSGTRGRFTGTVRTGNNAGLAGLRLLLAVYLMVMLALAVGSFSGVWPFPRVWPQTITWGAWQSVWASSATVGTTLTLALASAAAALAWAVAWLETAPRAWDDAMRRLVYLPLVLPSVLWVVGVHATTLRWGMDARWSGLWLAHSLACVPYVLITLAPAYGGFDPRYRAVTATLGHGRARFLLQVKWPLLRPALWSAFGVGFAVSVAQYLPTLFIGAGRFATVTTEAVTLASGAQRSLTSAYAWLQWVLPVLVFSLAAWAGRPRRFRRRGLS